MDGEMSLARKRRSVLAVSARVSTKVGGKVRRGWTGEVDKHTSLTLLTVGALSNGLVLLGPRNASPPARQG